MSRRTKLIGVIVALPLLAAAYVVEEWVRFVEYSEVDAKRDLHQIDGYWRWVDFHKMMPVPLRSWACARLLARQVKAPIVPPPGCDPARESTSMYEYLIQLRIDEMKN